MSDTVLLRIVDWALYERLRSHLNATTSMAELADRLATERYHDEEVRSDDAGRWEQLDPGLFLPRFLRRSPAEHAKKFADWIKGQPPEIADDALLAASFVDRVRELLVPDYLLLAWFSPRYRHVAIGIPGSAHGTFAPYDGPPALPDAVAAQLREGDPAFRLHDPPATRHLYDALAPIRLQDGGRGDVGRLLDFIESHLPTSGDLLEGLQASVRELQDTYAEAARVGHGVLVMNG